MLGLFYPSRGI